MPAISFQVSSPPLSYITPFTLTHSFTTSIEYLTEEQRSMESKSVKPQLKKHLWKPEEDLILKNYVETHGEGNWATVSERSGRTFLYYHFPS